MTITPSSPHGGVTPLHASRSEKPASANPATEFLRSVETIGKPMSIGGHTLVELKKPEDFIQATNLARKALQDKGSPAGFLLRERTPEYYTDSGARMFVTEDGHAGVAVKTKGADDGEIVSGFTSPGDEKSTRVQQLRSLLHACTRAGGRHFSAYDVNGLREMYKESGFHVVATMPTAHLEPAAAAAKYPPAWNEWSGKTRHSNGQPQGLYYVHDPMGGTASKEPVVVDSYAKGCAQQHLALAAIQEDSIARQRLQVLL